MLVLTLTLTVLLSVSGAAPTTIATCGGPVVDWMKVPDKVAPTGWQAIGFSGHVGNQKLCGNGWNGYAGGANQAQLITTLKGQGRATVEYRDCWKQGFVGLYLNGKKIDVTDTNNGALRIFRYAGM